MGGGGMVYSVPNCKIIAVKSLSSLARVNILILTLFMSRNRERVLKGQSRRARRFLNLLCARMKTSHPLISYCQHQREFYYSFLDNFAGVSQVGQEVKM